jgi:hypothetical protein
LMKSSVISATHSIRPHVGLVRCLYACNRVWWSADRKSDFGRVLRYGSDDWMA